MAVANTLAYNGAAYILVVKSSIAKVQAQWVYSIESFAAVIYNFGIYGNSV
jgi:hypothetical protein